MSNGEDVLRVESRKDEPEFNSFQAAINSTFGTMRTEQAAQSTRILKGATIVAAECSDVELALQLDNQSILTFYLDGGTVKWRLQQDIGGKRLNLTTAASLKLQFPKRPSPYLWDRSKLTNSLQGNRIRLVAASHAWAFLEVESLPTIMFTRIHDIEKGRDILFFDPE
jgi:hypothetical protein